MTGAHRAMHLAGSAAVAAIRIDPGMHQVVILGEDVADGAIRAPIAAQRAFPFLAQQADLHVHPRQADLNLLLFRPAQPAAARRSGRPRRSGRSLRGNSPQRMKRSGVKIPIHPASRAGVADDPGRAGADTVATPQADSVERRIAQGARRTQHRPRTAGRRRQGHRRDTATRQAQPRPPAHAPATRIVRRRPAGSPQPADQRPWSVMHDVLERTERADLAAPRSRTREIEKQQHDDHSTAHTSGPARHRGGESRRRQRRSPADPATGTAAVRRPRHPA